MGKEFIIGNQAPNSAAATAEVRFLGVELEELTPRWASSHVLWDLLMFIVYMLSSQVLASARWIDMRILFS